ncbi:hypothetical protein D3C84_600330 [compost metagenome]
MKKATRSEEQGSQSHGQITTATSARAPSKIASILGHLLNDGPLNRFEAERIGDHCLHSTISSLANGYGLAFKRTPEKVPNHWGQPCDVIRYALPRIERRRARAVLDMLTRKKQRRAAA